MKIVHVISGLETGGAERMLIKLIDATRNNVHHIVISLREKSTQGDVLEEMGIPVYSLELNSLKSLAKGVNEYRKVLKKESPDLIQGWMYHGNLFALLAKTGLRKNIDVIFNIRHSLHNIKNEKRLTQLVLRGNSWFTGGASGIIYNSQTSKNQHENIGFISKNSMVIPNGFNTNTFRFNRVWRMEVRKELELTDDILLFGQIGRNHPMKDHVNFVKASIQLLEKKPNTHFLLVGRGINEDVELQKLINDKSNHFTLFGQRTDIEKIWNGVDVGVLSSAWGEAFPNVIGEAMACETPCIVTDVGDAKYIVGEYGKVIPPQNTDQLANAMNEMAELSIEKRRFLGDQASYRVKKKFSIEKISEEYLLFYQKILVDNSK